MFFERCAKCEFGENDPSFVARKSTTGSAVSLKFLLL